MSIPQHTEQFVDGNLGTAPPAIDEVRMFLGPCQTGTANTLYGPYYSPEAIYAAHGYGAAPEDASLSAGLAGGPVYIMPITKSVAGANSAVSTTGTGTCVLAVSGTPLDSYEVIVEIIDGAATLAAGTATWRYTLDGGDNYSAELAMPVSGIYSPAGTGLTFNFTNGAGTAFVAGDTRTFTSTGPGYGASDVTSALTAFRALSKSGEVAYVVLSGRASSASGTATIAAAAATEMDAFETAHKFLHIYLHGAADTDANFLTAFSSFVNSRVIVIAGDGEIVSKLTGRVHKRNVAQVVEPRIAALAPSDHPGYVDRGQGALAASLRSIYRDEAQLQTLSDARFTTVRTWDGYPGFFVCEFWTMATPGSDYAPGMNRRVMDKIARIGRRAAIGYVSLSKLQVEPATLNGQANPRKGYIRESQARDFEAAINAELRALEGVDTSDAPTVTMRRDEDILATGTVTFAYRATPYGYARQIVSSFGFSNPRNG